MSANLPAVQEQTGLSPLDPQSLISQAISIGTPVETIEKLVDLAIRMREVQAREAYSAALASFQKECPPILKLERARIRTKTGPGYEYSYASLDGVLDVAQPVANEHGLSISWKTRTDGKSAFAKCVLRHALGHNEEGDEIAIPIEQTQEGGTGASPAQRVGIALTYAKRYAALSALGLAPEKGEDTDGKTGNGRTQEPSGDDPGQVTTISEGQVKRFWAIARSSGWTEPEVKTLLGKHGVESTSAIPTTSYDELCNTLKGGTGAS